MALWFPSLVSGNPGVTETVFLTVEFIASWFVGRYHSDCEWFSSEFGHAVIMRTFVRMERLNS